MERFSHDLKMITSILKHKGMRSKQYDWFSDQRGRRADFVWFGEQAKGSVRITRSYSLRPVSPFSIIQMGQSVKALSILSIRDIFWGKTLEDCFDPFNRAFFTWRHNCHVGVPKQWNFSPFALCKNFLLFRNTNMAVVRALYYWRMNQILNTQEKQFFKVCHQELLYDNKLTLMFFNVF